VNFDGEITIDDTDTGGNTGSDLCLDSNDKVCVCGSCA